MDNRQIIYVAFGTPYMIMAMNSIRTLRQHNPNIPVIMLTNVSSEPPNVPFWTASDKWIHLDEEISRNRNVKTAINSYADEDKVLYLDCDTMITGSLQTGFELLDHFDIALRPHHNPIKSEKARLPLFDGSKVAGDLPHWNSGVFFFQKNETVDDFFGRWYRGYTIMGVAYDQISLVEALFESKVRICPLDMRWNAPLANYKKTSIKKKTVIVHYASNINKEIEQDLLKAQESIRSSVDDLPPCDIAGFIRERRHNRLKRGKSLDEGRFARLWRKLVSFSV